MSSSIRRVVTGKDATGKAVILMEGAASNVRARKETGVTATFLWLTDSTPADVSLTVDPVVQASAVHPPPGGTVFRVVEFAPEKDVTADYETRLRMMRQMGLYPEGPTRDRPRDPGMHRTRTLDYAIILTGEIDLLLDEDRKSVV